MLMGALSAAAATINGIVVDATDTTELVGATVTLLRANGDKYVSGTTSDDHGVFNITGVQQGQYKLKVSYMGYADAVRNVLVGADGRDVNVGVVSLSTSAVRLKEAVVVGVKTPITVKEDTVEYNADSYKTQANAVVEDLLKRLPGVEVGSDGKITANGKSVTKVLINGKEFFSDDPTVASKNIPAKMVDKLQVIDRKSDLARLTGVDDGEDETVINLTVKKDMNNGWFGNVTGGYGTDNRYTGNLMANYFADGNQFTIMGGGNNTNNMGFTDGGASRFQRLSGSNGITESQNVGVNFNVGTRDSERLRVGGDVMYSHTDRNSISSSARTYLTGDTISFLDDFSHGRDKGHNVRGDFRLKWEIDSQNTIEFRPNFSFNFSNSASRDSSNSSYDAGNQLVPLYVSTKDNSSDGRSYEASGQLVWNHKVRSHPGRSFSAQLRYSYSNIDEDSYTGSSYKYYTGGLDNQETRLTDNLRHTNGVNGRLTWTEPLGHVSNARFLTVAYSANYKVSKATKSVYDLVEKETPSATLPYTGNIIASLLTNCDFRQYLAEQYGSCVLTDATMLTQALDNEVGSELERVFNERLSNDFSNRYFNQSMEFGFRQVRKAYNLNVGFSVQSAMSSSTDLINSARNIPSHWVWSVAPFARLRYKFSKTRSLQLDYRMRSSQPSLTQLQPVADESDPLNIVVGNPDLKPTFTHRMHLRYNDFNQEAQRSIMLTANATFEQNSIVRKMTQDAATGIRTTTYTNEGGVWSAMATNMLSFPFTSSKTFFFTNNLSVRYNHTVGYSNSVFNKTGTFSVSEAPGIAFRNSMFDIELRPNYSYQTTSYSASKANGTYVHTYGGKFNANYTAPFGLVLSTDLTFKGTYGYAEGYDSKQWLWNASVGYQFLRGKNASVQLSVYDILNQRKSVNRTVTANYIEDASYNTLTRYGMLTFTYRFTTFKKGEGPKDRRRGGDDDGPRERPSMNGGTPPMGPPPGGGAPGGGPGGGF